jgi:hypothetical protein
MRLIGSFFSIIALKPVKSAVFKVLLAFFQIFKEHGRICVLTYTFKLVENIALSKQSHI